MTGAGEEVVGLTGAAEEEEEEEEVVWFPWGLAERDCGKLNPALPSAETRSLICIH